MNDVEHRAMVAYTKSLERALDDASAIMHKQREAISTGAWAIDRVLAFVKAKKEMPEEEANHICQAESGLRASLQWKTVEELRP